MGKSSSKLRKNKFEGAKEQSNDNHPTRNRELTERNNQSLSSRKQHNGKTEQVEDSSDSGKEQLKVIKSAFFGVHSQNFLNALFDYILTIIV